MESHLEGIHRDSIVRTQNDNFVVTLKHRRRIRIRAPRRYKGAQPAHAWPSLERNRGSGAVPKPRLRAHQSFDHSFSGTHGRGAARLLAPLPLAGPLVRKEPPGLRASTVCGLLGMRGLLDEVCSGAARARPRAEAAPSRRASSARARWASSWLEGRLGGGRSGWWVAGSQC